jgi:hypothetical protein
VPSLENKYSHPDQIIREISRKYRKQFRSVAEEGLWKAVRIRL